MSKTSKKNIIKNANGSIINKDVIKTKIDSLIENGRKEIKTKDELEKLPIGSLISYISKSNVFRPAGFLTAHEEDGFVYVASDFKTRYRVKYGKVKKMWVGSVYECTNDIVSIVKTKQKKTNFPVVVNNITIYYAAKTFDKKRFLNTKRAQMIMNWIEYFENNE